jgi:spore coat polysaccharide biosynthesis protein SpsF
MSHKVVAIIQARMKSSRLPDKVMLDIAGKPMLQRVIERVSQASQVHEVMVATTSDPDEDPIAELCGHHGIRCYRGSLHDVLDRYYQAATEAEAGIVVRITADCPMIDPGLIDETIQALLGQTTGNAIWKPQGNPAVYPPATVEGIPWDYASTRLPPPWNRTFPIGLDVEAFTYAALARAWREAKQQYEREHVLPYIYEEPNRFRCLVADWPVDLGEYRWTVDTAIDLDAMREVYGMLPNPEKFSWQDVLDLYRTRPRLAFINAGIHHKDFREVDSRR